MMRRIVSTISVFIIGISLYSCATMAPDERLPVTHPVDLGRQQPVCTNCHNIRDENFPYARYNHTSDFGTRHRLTAFENERSCRMCHQQTFCSTCHAARTELKPATRFPDKTTRRFLHRGDYLSRHRVDGRLNPASCIRCHGTSTTSKRCRQCHG